MSEGIPMAVEQGTFAPCPYCSHTVRFQETDQSGTVGDRQAHCQTCGRTLALTWTEQQVRVLVVTD
jgi:DNA-directed RNA polymerase subunit RPC12/RpoP